MSKYFVISEDGKVVARVGNRLYLSRFRKHGTWVEFSHYEARRFLKTYKSLQWDHSHKNDHGHVNHMKLRMVKDEI